MRIIIIGGVKEGKTTMSGLIAAMLNKSGIAYDASIDCSMESLVEKIKNVDNIFKGKIIKVETFQTARSKKETDYQLRLK